jgi:O-antigen ligase
MFSGIAGRVTSFFDNPNVLGEYIILLFPLLLVLLLNMRGFKKRFLLVLAIAISSLCLVWTWSRGAWVGFIVGITLFFLIYSRKTLAVLLAVGASLPFIGYFLPSDIVGRFMSIGNMSDSSTYYRVFTWRGVLRMLKEVWLSGIGVGQTAFEQYYPLFAYAGTEASPHAHNLAMQIISDSGIFGFVTFIIIIFLFLQNGFEFIKKNPGKERLTVAAGIAGVVSFLVMGMFDYVWYNYRVFFLFWIIIALTVSFINSVHNENESVYDKIKTDSVDITLP